MGTRDLLHELTDAGLSVTAEGDRLVIRPASKLTDDQRALIRQSKSELLELLRPAPSQSRNSPAAVWWGWDEEAIVRFQDRRDRLMRWGWAERDAEATAERLVRRDAEGDGRAICVECVHHRPGRCQNHRAAGLLSPDVGRDLSMLLQRCPGFAAGEP